MEITVKNWGDLKDFIDHLSEDQLRQDILFAEEDGPTRKISPSVLEDDVYYNTDEPEDCGTLEELKENDSDFNIENYQKSFSKGTVFFFDV